MPKTPETEKVTEEPTITLPTDPTPLREEGLITHSASATTLPNALVPATPVTLIATGSPHVPEPQP